VESLRKQGLVGRSLECRLVGHSLECRFRHPKGRPTNVIRNKKGEVPVEQNFSLFLSFKSDRQSFS